MHRCCPSLMKYTYSFTDRYTGARRINQCAEAVLQDAKFSLDVFGWGTCTRCGYEPDEEVVLDSYADFVSHCETINDPL